jgi:hypothetical protein
MDCRGAEPYLRSFHGGQTLVRPQEQLLVEKVLVDIIQESSLRAIVNAGPV